LKTVDDEPHRLIQCDPEPCHALVCDGQLSRRCKLSEERNDGTAAPHHVSVTDHTESGLAVAGVCVACHEEFVGAQFRGSIEVDRRRCLVRGKADDPLHAGVNAGVDQILGAHDVCPDALKWVVLGGVYLLHRRRMNHGFDAIEGPCKPVRVPDVSDEPSKARIVANLGSEFVLFEFISGEDD
jgi:hypothetical protein